MGKYPEIFDYFSVADRVNGDHFHHGAIFLEGDGDEKLVSHFFHFLVNQCFRLRLYMHTTYLSIYLLPSTYAMQKYVLIHISFFRKSLLIGFVIYHVQRLADSLAAL